MEDPFTRYRKPRIFTEAHDGIFYRSGTHDPLYGQTGSTAYSRCIQRIHVTGGTNGILTEFLRKHRPFTPSFVGRAEDQSYILSVLMNKGTKLAYFHEDGLIMRHDKEAFASDAIKAASHGSTIGDYIRILYFSKYAEILTDRDIDKIKRIIDPLYRMFCFKTSCNNRLSEIRP